MRIAQLLLAIAASGLMLVLALPLGEQAYLGWFAFAPMLAVVRGRGFLSGFVGGLAVCFLAAFLSSTGIFYAHRDSGPGPAWLFTSFGLFGFIVSLASGLWADRSTAKLPTWWFAAVATLLEAVLLFQLPAHLALTQYRQQIVLQVASVGGIWLVSFLLWWANFAIATIRSKQLIAIYILVGFISLGLGAIYFSASGHRITVAAVQAADPDTKSLTEGQREASRQGAVLAVWPEFSGIAMTAGADTSELRKLSGEPGIAPFVTTFEDEAKPKPRNVSALFSHGAMSETYAKRKLFGGETNMHSSGDHAVSVPYAAGNLGLVICYDSCFPGMIRETARMPGVNLLALPSIDPPSSHSFVSAMHAAYTPFRAAEEGIAIVKGDGFAYSVIVDPWGAIVAMARPGDRVLVGNVSVERHGTLYALLGDWFLWASGLLVLAGIWRARKATSAEPASTVE